MFPSIFPDFYLTFPLMLASLVPDFCLPFFGQPLSTAMSQFDAGRSDGSDDTPYIIWRHTAQTWQQLGPARTQATCHCLCSVAHLRFDRLRVITGHRPAPALFLLADCAPQAVHWRDRSDRARADQTMGVRPASTPTVTES